MIKKIRYGSLIYDTLFDTLIGDALIIKKFMFKSKTHLGAEPLDKQHTF
jgi:hypothetical protein